MQFSDELEMRDRLDRVKVAIRRGDISSSYVYGAMLARFGLARLLDEETGRARGQVTCERGIYD